MTITAAQSTPTYDVEHQSHQLRAPIHRTRMTSVEPDWLSDVVADWDAVFGDDSMTATRSVDSTGWVSTCQFGDRPASIAWLGREALVLHDAPAASMSWDVLLFHHKDRWPSSHATILPDPGVTLAATPDSPTADVIAAVDSVAQALGVAERDVLAAAGIHGRTYYYWKRNPAVTPRPGSQANLWGMVSSVAAIVVQLDDLTPRWLRADPDRLNLFLSGQHARLAMLAAAAAEDVRIPSDTVDGQGGVAEEFADIQRLKRFRTRHAVILTHDEDGTPLGRATDLAARFYPDEPEDELILIDVDD